MKEEGKILGKTVTVIMDRPMGTYHPEHKDMYYPVNYGYVPGIIAGDGEEQDAYVLGVDEPLPEFAGVIIAVIHRLDDVEEKWVVAPEGVTFSKEEIWEQVKFQEQYFQAEIQMKEKVIVFDLGGTLMQYVGMPYSWVDFYQQGFEAIIKKYNCKVSEESLEKSLQMLKEFNPRVNYREVEYPAEYIFSKILEHWDLQAPLNECIETFWSGLKLKAEIYPDTLEVLRVLKEKGYIIATLTDLPSAMPDEVFKKDITKLLEYFDYYVSSSVAGYRKPSKNGLEMISEKYGIPITELLFVGDEEKDRETAHNANCAFIKIDRKAKSEGCIRDLHELLKMVK